MTMILEHGKNYKTTICEHCGAKIGFGDADIQPFQTMDIDWNKIYIDVVRCPECGELTDADKMGNMALRGIAKVI